MADDPVNYSSLNGTLPFETGSNLRHAADFIDAVSKEGSEFRPDGARAFGLAMILIDFAGLGYTGCRRARRRLTALSLFLSSAILLKRQAITTTYL